MNIDQYKELLKHIPAINAALREQGVDVDDVEDAGAKGGSLTKKENAKAEKAKKANIDATSDEDEE